MMTNILNKAIIDEIFRKTGNSEKASLMLMDTLFLSKDAIYRRLRNEVPFTMDEVAKISGKLNISIDNIIGTQTGKNILSELTVIDVATAIDNYADNIKEHIALFKELSKDPSSKIYAAFNMLPYYTYIDYPEVAKFNLYRWLYQLQSFNLPMSELEIADRILELQRQYAEWIHKAADIEAIITKHALRDLLGDIIYFRRLNLINEYELATIRQELIQITNDVDAITKDGRYPDSDRKISLYLSDLSLDSCYTQYESQNIKCASIRTYLTSEISYREPKVTEFNYQWILSLRRHSTLITQSSERIRIEFIQSQRKLIDEMFGQIYEN